MANGQLLRPPQDAAGHAVCTRNHLSGRRLVEVDLCGGWTVNDESIRSFNPLLLPVPGLFFSRGRPSDTFHTCLHFVEERERGRRKTVGVF